MIPGLGIVQDLETRMPMHPAALEDPGGLGINPVFPDTPLLEQLLMMLLTQGGMDPNALAGLNSPQLGGRLQQGAFSSHVGGVSKKKSGGDGPPPGP